jgi:heme-degrading monooxygenase HmoA
MGKIAAPLQERRERALIRSVLYVEPRDGDHGAIVRFYRERRLLERAAEVDGFISSELHVPLERGPLLVTALWRDADAYRRWLEHPARAAAADGLASLVEEDFDAQASGDVYEVVLAEPDRGPQTVTV